MIPVLGNASLRRGPNLATGQECLRKIERQSQMMYIALGVGTEFHPEFIPTSKKWVAVNPTIEVPDPEPSSG